ncbi:MAG: DNA polymerase III subunit beta, partial [Phycisphaerae bacterium]|nr:DNA polymerase III subunit beta [Phycisphaerae bacterium]
PDFEGEPDLTIAGDELRRMIALTAYAAARETSRYAINGVLWDKRGKKMFMVATDGRRLARAGGTLQGGARGADFQLIVPSKALSVFERVFQPGRGAEGWEVEVRVLPNQVVLRSGDRVLSSALVEGNFPKYEDVIPKDNDKCAHMGREELNRAIRRAALLTTEDSRAVRLSFEPGKLVVYANSPEQGEARIELPVTYDGEPVEIGFNPNFVNDALRAVPYDTVQIEMQESFRPGVLAGEDKNEFLYVIMPVSLSSPAS